MKKSHITLPLVFMAILLFIFSACVPKKDSDTAQSVQSPDDQNASLIDTKADNKDDNEYAVKAADGGMYEVQLGKLAVERATSPSVKQLGQMMVDDHSKANDELKAIAVQKGITLPTMLSTKLQKKYDDIASKTGTDFDRAYSSAMVKDHKEDIQLFKKEAADGRDQQLKAFAQGKIPVLEHHLKMSQSTSDGLRKK